MLMVLLALRKPIQLDRRLWAATAALGFFQTSLFNATLSFALLSGTVGKSGMLTYTMPFWVLLMAWPVLGERIIGVQWLAVALAFAGLLCELEPWSQSVSLSSGLLAVATGFSWGVATIITKTIQKRYSVDSLLLTAWQMACGSVASGSIARITRLTLFRFLS